MPAATHTVVTACVPLPASGVTVTWRTTMPSSVTTGSVTTHASPLAQPATSVSASHQQTAETGAMPLARQQLTGSPEVV